MNSITHNGAGDRGEPKLALRLRRSRAPEHDSQDKTMSRLKLA